MVRCMNRFTRSVREEGEPSSPVVEVATGMGVWRTTSSTLPWEGCAVVKAVTVCGGPRPRRHHHWPRPRRRSEGR
jgi:hypothetical protein